MCWFYVQMKTQLVMSLREVIERDCLNTQKDYLPFITIEIAITSLFY